MIFAVIPWIAADICSNTLNFTRSNGCDFFQIRVSGISKKGGFLLREVHIEDYKPAEKGALFQMRGF